MGMRSESLYRNLTSIVAEKDVSVLTKLEPRELMPELLTHMTETIPKEIFETTEDISEFLERLKAIGNHLNTQFVANHSYPFTIQRICEICYHPLKYFKTHEVGKFVNALEKCCLVRSSLNVDGETTCDAVNDGGDLSLSKIPWVTAEEEKTLSSFLRDVEAMVSVNFGYENDEEEDGADDADHARNMAMGNAYGSEEDDDEDGDYVCEVEQEDEDEEIDGEEDQDEEEEDEENEDEEEEEEEEKVDDEEKRQSKNLVDSKSIDGEQSAGAVDEEETTSEDEDPDAPDALRKRRQTEFDDYDYDDEPGTENTTPKKKRAGLAPSASLAESPLFLQGTAVQTPSLEQQVSMLISPSTTIQTETCKITAVTDTDGRSAADESSPLSNKSGRR